MSRLRLLPILCGLLLAANVQHGMVNAQAIKTEGDPEMFGQWQFEVKSLTRTAEAIGPVVSKAEACIRPGVEPTDLPLMAIPRRGRCALKNFLAGRSNVGMVVQCDEGDGGGTFLLSLDPQKGEGDYRGDLSYGITFGDSAQGFSSYAEVTAKRLGACGGTP